MVCERCGHEIAKYHRSPICPICGTALLRNTPPFAGTHTQTGYSTSTQRVPSTSLPGQAKKDYQTALQRDRISYSPSIEGISDTQRPFFAIKQQRILQIEFLFSLLGMFGIGWLLAGELAIGIILLACSILIYWPIIFLSTIFTFGIAWICLGPLAVGTAILNIYLLSHRLKRKASHLKQPPTPFST